MRRLVDLVPLLVLGLAVVGWLGYRVASDPGPVFSGARPEAGALDVLPEVEPLPPCVVAGRALGPEREPIAFAFVHLDQVEAPRWTTADEQGAFRIEGRGAPPWRVSVAAPGYVPQQFDVAASPADLVVERRAEPPPRFPDVPRRSLEGRVLSALPGGDLTGYEVELFPLAPPQELSGLFPRRADVAADGRFSIEGLAVGEYRAVVLPPWARGAEWPDLCAESARSYVHRLEDAGPVELPISAGEVRGAVTDNDGEFLEGAVVWTEDETDATRLWPTTASDRSGLFLVRDLPPGGYRLTVRAGEGEQSARLQVIAGTTRTIEFELEPRRGGEDG